MATSHCFPDYPQSTSSESKRLKAAKPRRKKCAAKEKLRNEEINKAFQILQEVTMLGVSASVKVPKIKTLKVAKLYIIYLMEKLNQPDDTYDPSFDDFSAHVMQEMISKNTYTTRAAEEMSCCPSSSLEYPSPPSSSTSSSPENIDAGYVSQLSSATVTSPNSSFSSDNTPHLSPNWIIPQKHDVNLANLIFAAQTALAILEMGTQQSRLRVDRRRPQQNHENGTPITLRDKPLDSTTAAKCWSFATCQTLTESSMDNDAYKPLSHEPVLKAKAPLATAELMRIDSKSIDDTPSVAAGTVVGTWKNGSIKRPNYLPMMSVDHSVKEPPTPAFAFDQTTMPGITAKSVTSIYTNSTCDTPDYHLSEHSQDMLMNIIRCFPFPTPKNSPKVVKRIDSKASLPGCTVEASSSSTSTPESPISYPNQVHEHIDTTKPPISKKHHYFSKHQATVANLFHRQHHAAKLQKKRASAQSGTDFSGSGTSTETLNSNGRPAALSTASAPGSVGIADTPEKEVKKSALSRLCQVSVDTMAITALPLDCWLKERLKKWVQLSGHEGTIVPATNQTLWKKQPNHNTVEACAYEEIMRDENLAGMTPKYFKEIEHKNESFIEIQDLLADFSNVSTRAIMDIKIGKRTFLEDEVANLKKRPDLYRKMIDIDPNEPTEEERAEQAITKMRYMQFRERESSSASLGFRIEAAQHPSGKLQKSFKKVRTRDQVVETLKTFLGDRVNEASRELEERLRSIRAAIERSEFFRTHEVVGSSVLLIYDHEKSGAWMIDFAKSKTVEPCLSLDHRSDWEVGNHEDGYLVGLDNLIEILSECHS